MVFMICNSWYEKCYSWGTKDRIIHTHTLYVIIYQCKSYTQQPSNNQKRPGKQFWCSGKHKQPPKGINFTIECATNADSKRITKLHQQKIASASIHYIALICVMNGVQNIQYYMVLFQCLTRAMLNNTQPANKCTQFCFQKFNSILFCYFFFFLFMDQWKCSFCNQQIWICGASNIYI